MQINCWERYSKMRTATNTYKYIYINYTAHKGK